MDFSDLTSKLARKMTSMSMTSDCVSFTLQMGLQKELVTFPRIRLSDAAVRDAAKTFVEKHFQLQKQPNEIMLFRHCSASENPLQLLQSIDEIDSGTVLEIVLSLDAQTTEYAHKVEVRTFLKPTYCDHCGELLVGLAKQGFQCLKCNGNYHERCIALPHNVCITTKTVVDYKPSGLPHTFVIHTFKKPTVCKNCQKLLKGLFHQGLQCHYCKVNVHKECANQTMKNCINRPDADNGEIPTPSISQLPTVLAGWLLHFTQNNQTWKRHYWILDPACISLYQDDTRTRRYKQIPLDTVLCLRSYDGMAINKQNPPHRFEIQTVGGTFYVAELDWFDAAGQIRPPQTAFSAMKWLGAIYEWLLPPNVFPVQTDPALAAFRDSFQLHCFEKLGSGNFGEVFGGVHRLSQEKVAIKLIRTPRGVGRRDVRSASFVNEIEILRKLNHPGIIGLKDVFEFQTAICVVTEKMEADMLCMIQSAEKARLSERVTKFLIMQILQALRYLHDQGIAHRDLKPENVLVSSAESDFPRVKLCDFGYARIMGETTYMKTLCGTPAYLAPEVREDNPSGYDKSIDMWATGVVIYVTLSGTFPFNHPEDRSTERINDDAFMFPLNPWHEMSTVSVQLIRSLLHIQPDHRLTVVQCIQHPWMHDEQLLGDLRALEESIGVQYLTV